MAWNEWLDVSFVRHVFRHISGTIVAILLFAVTGWVARSVMHTGFLRDGVEQVENVVLLSLVVLLAIQLLAGVIKQVAKQMRGGWNGTQVLAL